MFVLREFPSYSEIYRDYWMYGFWYERLGAITLWIMLTLFLAGMVVIGIFSVISIIGFFF